jgi:hypothetical protein
MGVGSPEYILLFHKPQTDRPGYADVPVTKDKADYTRARWQVDAHAFWRSSGDRPSPPTSSPRSPRPDVPAVHRADAARGLRLRVARPHRRGPRRPRRAAGDVHEPRARLVAPRRVARRQPDAHPQHRAVPPRAAMHVCPLQFDIVDRLIERYSNPGDLVYDPFGGLFTVPSARSRLGRRGRRSSSTRLLPRRREVPAARTKERQRKQKWREENRRRKADGDATVPSPETGHETGRSTGQGTDGGPDPHALGDAGAHVPGHPRPGPSPVEPPLPPTSPEATRDDERGEGWFDLDDHTDPLAALTARVHARRPEWTPRGIRQAAVDCIGDGRSRDATAVALLRVADDPASFAPGRVRADGPWWRGAAPAPARTSDPPPGCPAHPGTSRRRDGECAGCWQDRTGITAGGTR